MNQEFGVFEAIEQRFAQERSWYRLHDVERTGGAVRVKRSDAESWNKNGWGIFHTVNAFHGSRRCEHLKAINSWAIDIDHGTKKAQLDLIKRCPIYPSLVIETKSGFHVYWNAKNAKIENYDAIIADRLIPHFKADPKARDLSRLFRVPGYYHQKNPKEPFLIRVKSWSECAYSEEDMFFAFKLSKRLEDQSKKRQELKQSIGSNLWEKVYNMDCELALTKLSGSPHVHGETYTFKRVSSHGHLNIHVNGKSTSCFIDKYKRIGSLDRGGPSIANWLKWYGRSWPEVVLILRASFPELFQEEQQS